MILKMLIEKLMRRENLSYADCEQAFEKMLDPATNPLQLAAFLVLLHAKSETADELSSFVKLLRQKMITVPTNLRVLDIVGTGGDRLNTINISTASAMLAASCGVKVAKHGSRSVSSLTGSADVLEALGVNIQLTPEQISLSIDQIGIGFCYAPLFHPVTQTLRDLRKTLNVPTTFNLLGPLLNPAKAAQLILGVNHEALLPVMADVLRETGHDRAVVVHGMGLDEISCAGLTQLIEINQQEKIEWILNPEEFGFARCRIDDLRGGDAKHNAQRLMRTFQGERGAIADSCILNAAVALYINGISPSIHAACEQARDNLYRGAVLTLLNNWIEFSHDQ